MFYDRVLCAGLIFYLSYYQSFQGGRMYQCGRQNGQALLQFLACGLTLCELQMCLALRVDYL